jgi:hypothetical protein
MQAFNLMHRISINTGSVKTDLLKEQLFHKGLKIFSADFAELSRKSQSEIILSASISTICGSFFWFSKIMFVLLQLKLTAYCCEELNFYKFALLF